MLLAADAGQGDVTAEGNGGLRKRWSAAVSNPSYLRGHAAS